MPLVIDAAELKESIRKYINEYITSKIPITYTVSQETLNELKWLDKTIMNEFKLIVLQNFTKQKIAPISGKALPEHIDKCINPLNLGDKLINKEGMFGEDLNGTYLLKTDITRSVIIKNIFLFDETKDSLLSKVEKRMIGIKALSDLSLIPKLQNIYICSTEDGNHFFLISIIENPSSKGTVISFKDWLKSNPSQSQKNKVKNFMHTQLSKFTKRTGLNFFSIITLQNALYLILDKKNSVKHLYFNGIDFSNESFEKIKKILPYIESQWDDKLDDVFVIDYFEKNNDDNDKVSTYVTKRLLQNGDLIYKT